MPNKEQLIEIVKKVLRTHQDLGFLSRLSQEELEVLVGCIRDRLDNFPSSANDN